ncbi:MAG TPA: thioredoxin domain-containing protein [Polyangia bacterium]|jgi:thiol:disulfide interchange protein
MKRNVCALAGALVLSASLALAAQPAPFTLEEITPAEGAFPAVLARELGRASAHHQTPFVWVSATWCGPCQKLKASLGDPRMKDAFSGTFIIHVDLDAWNAQLARAGFHVGGVPAFFALDAHGRPTGRTITGAAWQDDVPANMAPPLKAFFRAK